jgi:eukaryotic-like serine/threonine-protein kinase
MSIRILEPGRECGPYTIVKEIGRGGMAVVYLAEGPEGEKRAVKTLQFTKSLQAEQLDRFRREIKILATIHHLNVVRFFDAGRILDASTGSLMWLALEYVEGLSLREIIHTRRGRISPVDAADWCAQIADGVAAAHSLRVVHRDLKPENTLLLENAGLVKVIDFGISKFRQWGVTTTAANMRMGTVGYMAPEQLGHDRDTVDARTDIYALGCILYELAAGAHPLAPDGAISVAETLARTLMFEPTPLVDLVPGFPQDLSDVARTALQKDPAARYATIEEMRDALRAAAKRYLNERRLAMLQELEADFGPPPPLTPAPKAQAAPSPAAAAGTPAPEAPSTSPEGPVAKAAQAAKLTERGGFATNQPRTVRMATPSAAFAHPAAARVLDRLVSGEGAAAPHEAQSRPSQPPASQQAETQAALSQPVPQASEPTSALPSLVSSPIPVLAASGPLSTAISPGDSSDASPSLPARDVSTSGGIVVASSSHTPRPTLGRRRFVASVLGATSGSILAVIAAAIVRVAWLAPGDLPTASPTTMPTNAQASEPAPARSTKPSDVSRPPEPATPSASATPSTSASASATPSEPVPAPATSAPPGPRQPFRPPATGGPVIRDRELEPDPHK